MTIQEVLYADWNIDKINVIIRDRETARYIMRYCIGRDAEPGLSERFLYESELGDVYGSSGINVIYIKRIIQHCQLKNLTKSQIGLRGVLEKEIPKELIKLTIDHMSPYDCGRSTELHGYRFECYVDAWNGIQGENNQIAFEELN